MIQMKAIQVLKPGDMRLMEIPAPVLKDDDDVLISVKAAGICGSDLHIAHGTNPYATYPRIPGHEVVGIVEQTGSAVRKLKKGDHVVLEPICYCGSCYACRHGRPNVCEHLQVKGVHLDGGFAQYMVSSQKYLHLLPENLPFETAALIEPFTIGAQANFRAGTQQDDTVLVHGAGPIGLIAMLAAKNLGARCFVSEISDSRRQMALELGADAVINPQSQDLFEAVMALTDGKGVNVVHEATGVPDLLSRFVQLASTAGRIVAFAFGNTPIPIDFAQVNKKELTILGTRHQTYQFESMIRYVDAHRETVQRLVTHVLPVSEFQKGFELFADKNSGACKVVLTME